MTRDELTRMIAEAVATATMPLRDELRVTQTKLTAAQDKLTRLNEKITVPAQERKSLPPVIMSLLQGGVVIDDDNIRLKN